MAKNNTNPHLVLATGCATWCVLLIVSLVVMEIDRATAWIATTTSSSKHNRIIHNHKSTQGVSLFATTTQRDEDQAEDSTVTDFIAAAFDESTKILPNPPPLSKSKHYNTIVGPNSEETKDGDLEEQFLSEMAALESFLSGSSEAVVHEGIPSSQTTLESKSNSRTASSQHKQNQNTINDAGFTSTTESIPYFLRPRSDGERNEMTNTNAEKSNTAFEASEYEHEHEHTLGVTNTNHLSVDATVPETKPKDTSVSDSNNGAAASIDRTIYAFNKNLVDVLYAAISFVYPTTSPSKKSPPTDLRSKGGISSLLGIENNEIEITPAGQKHTISTQDTTTVLRFEKFYVFETVARIPYFAYLSVLHLRETLGDRGLLSNDGTEDEIISNHKRTETMRTHYAQADNELHHLLIMESLGGNSRRIDRILAHSMAFSYYWFVVLVFSWNEQAAYHLNEVIEDHAYNAYEQFLAQYEDELRALPVPDIARKYYEADYQKNPHLFEAFCAVAKNPESSHSETQTSSSSSRTENRPHELHSLYDVFRNVRDDEREHWMTLCNLVQYDDLGAVDAANVQSTKGKDH